MNYHNITTNDMLNGDGLRVVLWVSGCNHMCKGCHNPYTWDAAGGLPFDEAAKAEVFSELEKPYIQGITFSGGDPLFPSNRPEVLALCREIRERFPNKDIWLYTGYKLEELGSILDGLVDVLIDDVFVESLADTKLNWRGSSNQTIYRFTDK